MRKFIPVLGLLCVGQVVPAAVLDFSSFVNNTDPVTNYGSTPAVAVTYRSYPANGDPNVDLVRHYIGGYSDLTHVIYAQGGPDSRLEVIFTPAAGYAVSISSVTAALYNPSFSVGDGETHLIGIEGSINGSLFTSITELRNSGSAGILDKAIYSFSVVGETDEVLTLRLEPAWYTALDDIVFSTIPAEVPEPGTFALLAAGVGLLGLRLRRRQ